MLNPKWKKAYQNLIRSGRMKSGSKVLRAIIRGRILCCLDDISWDANIELEKQGIVFYASPCGRGATAYYKSVAQMRRNLEQSRSGDK